MSDAITEAANALLVPVDENGTEVVEQQTDEGSDGQGAESEGEGQQEAAKTPEEELIEELAAEESEKEGEGDDIPPPPNSWKAEEAEVWAEMPERAREIVARREKEQHEYITGLGRKSADERRQLEQQVTQALAQEADKHANELYAYMQLTAPPEPDQRLLYGNQDDVLVYHRQEAAYRNGLAQQRELQQRIAAYQQQAEEARSYSTEAEWAAGAELLQSELPDFFDPEEGPKLRQTLESIGSDLGYPPEVLSQANAVDIIALKKIAEYRDDALKYRKIMAKRMETVRGAKNLPSMSRPNAGQGPGVAQAASEERRAAAINQFQRDRSGEAAFALLAQPRK